MLDTDTKRNIDNARDILVGKVPNPQSQVEQITIALIYKFMDDIDAEAEDLGGERNFFAGEFARYGWAKLVRSGLGGHEVLKLYAEAITRMPENSGVPLLFRSIFNNAYLPYRDPEILRAFLKVIDKFAYDDSERLGDAFEYLLSILGSQGDAGQFRTPRHIIDFIVAIIDPKKNETILDPACGTAGFLISSYKHILKSNMNKDGENSLTPSDRCRLAANLTGYDISPDFVRLSLVNMYLHGLADPHISEYDTLTSEDRWNEYADVILANPPFMSPKGGIRPHNRFSVKSKRSEVLFVDYMAEHLTPQGRAGIIVPEGIIFQSQNACKQLRKRLVENYLVAVISLPAGVFNPYSGVKTSILILDKSLVKRTDRVAFFKVENDGFDLGAQRRPVNENDLPQVQSDIVEYLWRLHTGESRTDSQSSLGLIVEKEKIAADGEHNLSGDRYRVKKVPFAKYPREKLAHLLEVITPSSKIPKSAFQKTGGYPIIDQSKDEIAGWTDKESALIRSSKPLVIFGDHTCSVKFVETPFAQGADGIKILQTIDILDPKFLYYVLRFGSFKSDGYRRHFSKLKEYEIPLPPLEVQKEIMAKFEGYQRVMDGARAVVKNYRPHIPLDPKWPMVELGEMCEVKRGKSLTRKEITDGDIPVIAGGQTPAYYHYQANRVGEVITVSGSGAYAGFVNFFDRPIFASDCSTLQIKAEDVLMKYVYLAMKSLQSDIYALRIGSAQPHVYAKDVAKIKIPLAPLDVQKKIVTEIEVEQTLVAANRELIERFEQKIQAAVARVWD
ncbi:MAG: N-6 DNA methylase [Nitrospira sp.]|nr:N-6 DNA methylase [Nitrospira sp.]